MQEYKVEIIPNTVEGQMPYQQYTNKEKTLIGVPVVEQVENESPLGGKDLEQSLFNPNNPNETIEVSIYDLNGGYLDTIYNFKDYTVTNDTNTSRSGSINTLNLDPVNILSTVGIAYGTFTLVIRFLKNQLNTSQETPDVFIEEISSDRTEVRLNSTKISSEELVNLATNFSDTLLDDNYYEDFYLNFGQNQLYIANNILVDTQSNPENPSILVHLYEPLPEEIEVNDILYVVTEQADPLNLSVDLPVNFQPLSIQPEEVPYLAGPNFNVEVQTQFNNPTDYLSYNNLTQIPLTSSYNQLQNILKQKGVNISIDYTKFEEFAHFSSVKQRLNNFYYKVGLIQSSSFELEQLSTTSDTYAFSSSKSEIETTISNVISNFDGFENYMYYESNSIAWPKQNTEPPYILFDSGSVEVLEWLGSDDPSNQYFGGRIESASNYDNFNPDALVKTIPEYLREDSNNLPYDLFINMIGQHFDNLYLYTKDVTNRYNNDNRLDFGISKDLVAQALRDFGIKLYQNNFSSNDLYSAFLGISASGSLLPPTGSEMITDYITGSDEGVPLNDVNKEVYKRLYHNLPYLLKKKGTIEGLRALITCFGIPTTILRISEFGGKDRINANDWDHFYQKYGRAFISSDGKDTAYPKIPWLPLTLNYIDKQELITPDTVEFRFKTTGIPPESHYSQSLWLVKTEKDDDDGDLDTSTNFDIGLFLHYTGSWALESGSWDGSSQSPYKEYGDLKLYLRKGDTTEYVSSTPVSLPFFNGDWWSVMIRRNDSFGLNDINTPTTYDVICKSKPYYGADGTTIALQGSGSLDNSSGTDIEAINSAWAYFAPSSQVTDETVFQPNPGYGGRFGYSGEEKKAGDDVLVPINTFFSGAFQEVRYYNLPLSESVFDDYVMNPESIEGINLTGSESSPRTLAFRAGLGNELAIPSNNEQGVPANYQIFNSIHPSIDNIYGVTTGSFLVTGMDASTPVSSTITRATRTGQQPLNLVEPLVPPKSSFPLPSEITQISISQIGETVTNNNEGILDALIDNGGTISVQWNSGQQIFNEYTVTGGTKIPNGNPLLNSYTLFVVWTSGTPVDLDTNLNKHTIIINTGDVQNLPTSSLYFIRDGQEFPNDFAKYGLRNDEVYYVDQPVVGIKNRISDKIKIESNETLGNALSSLRDVEPFKIANQSYTKDINYLEVAFSPQNEINDDIVASLGYFDIGGYIGDPRQATQSNYPDLESLQQEYFKKYSKEYNLKDYVRLIKYFDNSLFKMVKDFVPARTGVATGIVMKQHLLERNKYISPQATFSLPNYSESIDVGYIEAGQPGVFDFEGRQKFNYTYPPQEFEYEIDTLAGDMTLIQDDESEFFTGELGGTHFIATDGEVSPGNDFRPLYGNIGDSTRSELYYRVRYDDGDVVPSNLDEILDGTAQPADVEDFNYFDPRSFIPRYNGSKHSSTDFGVLNRSTGYVPVDPGSIYFTNIVKGFDTSPEYIHKTYLSIDKFVNQTSDVYDPRNSTIPQFIDFKHTFKRGDIVSVKIDPLYDVRRYDELPGLHEIYKIGRYNTIICTNSSTASQLLPNDVEGASGSRIGRINFVNPNALDQGDASILVDPDADPSITPFTNFNAKAYFRVGNQSLPPSGLFNNTIPGNPQVINTNLEIPETSTPAGNAGVPNRPKFGFQGYWPDNSYGGPGWVDADRTGWYDPNNVIGNSFDGAEDGVQWISATEGQSGLTNAGIIDPGPSNSGNQRYAVAAFKYNSLDNPYGEIPVKVKARVWIANDNSAAGNDSRTMVDLEIRNANGSLVTIASADINIGIKDIEKIELETSAVQVEQGGYIVFNIRNQKDECFVVGEFNGEKSYVETIMDTPIDEPEEGGLVGLPSQLYLHPYYASDVLPPSEYEDYPYGDIDAQNASNKIIAVGYEPVLFNNHGDDGQLQILSSSQTDYFSRGPSQIEDPNNPGNFLTIIPPSSSRGYDQSLLVPFSASLGDEIRFAYDESRRFTIVSMSLGTPQNTTAFASSTNPLTWQLFLDGFIEPSFWNQHGQNFIINHLTENNSGFMLNTRKKFPDIGDSTTKESYVTPILISEKLDRDLYAIVRDLSTDEGVF